MKRSCTLCHFQSIVVEVSDYRSDCIHYARNHVRILNDQIVERDSDLDNEFWFLKQQIKGATHVIVHSSYKEFAPNDPEIVAKLKDYLERDPDHKGGSRKQGKRNRP